MSRGYHLIGAIVSTAWLAVVALFILPWIRDKSTSVTADFVLILLWVFGALTAGWFQVSLAIKVGAEKESVFSTETIVRSLLVVIAIMANLFWSNYAAGDFWFSHYGKVGVYSTALRSSSPETKRWAIKKVAEMVSSTLLIMLPKVGTLIDDEDTEVRADAVACVGHVAFKMRIALRESAGGLAGFEQEALRLAKEILKDTKARLENSKGKEKIAWLYAMGCIADDYAIGVLSKVLKEATDGSEEQTAVLGALIDLAEPRAGVILARAAKNTKGFNQMLATYGAATMMAGMVERFSTAVSSNPDYLAMREAMLDAFPSLEINSLCAFLRSFRLIGDADFTDVLVQRGTEEALASKCERAERKRWFGAPDSIVPEAKFWVLYLDAVSAIAVGNKKVVDHLKKLAMSDGLPQEVRQQASSLLRELGQ